MQSLLPKDTLLRTCLQKIWPGLDPNCSTLIIFLKELFKNIDFGKNQRTIKYFEKLPSKQRVNIPLTVHMEIKMPIDRFILHAVILFPFLGYSLCLLNFRIFPNKILILGKKSPRLGKYRSILDWEAAFIRL